MMQFFEYKRVCGGGEDKEKNVYREAGEKSWTRIQGPYILY